MDDVINFKKFKINFEIFYFLHIFKINFKSFFINKISFL